MNQPITNQPTTPTNATMEIPTETKRHPIRGFIWGLITGIGLALVLVVTKVITLAITPVVVTIIVTALLGTIWGLVGPAKKAKGPVPVKITPTPAPPPSRFDDFTDPVEPPAAPVEPAPGPVEAASDLADPVAEQAPGDLAPPSVGDAEAGGDSDEH